MPDSIDHEQESAGLHSYTAFSHRSGGPSSPAGKSRSSKNSLKHGCRSHILILDNEDPAEFEALRDRWLDAYQPDTEAALELTEQFILSKWYLLRNERRYAEVEYQLSFFEYTKWDQGQHRIYQLTLRYKTAAERAVSKAQHDLEDYLKNRRAEDKHRSQMLARDRASHRQIRKDLEQREQSLEKKLHEAQALGLDITAEAAQLAQLKQRHRTLDSHLAATLDNFERHRPRPQLLLAAQNSPKQLPVLPILQQSIEVTVTDGVTRTQLTPSNQELLQQAAALDAPYALIYRRLDFPHVIPDEYSWVTDDPLLRQIGGLATQRLPLDTWLDLIALEQLSPAGHIGPAPQPLPGHSPGCAACDAIRQRLFACSQPEPR